MHIWKLRNGADRRIRSGHPWVFSNELSQSPKGLPPGTPVRLLDHKGNFLASGYGNPNSLIAFRALSFDSQVENPCHHDELIAAIVSTWGHRHILGFDKSFRLVYGEGDALPGLVIDRYKVGSAQVFAVQLLTYGMQNAIGPDDQNIEKFFKNLVEETLQNNLSDFNWDQTSVVLRNDVNIRRLEGLDVPEARVLKKVEGLDLTHALIELAAVHGDKPLQMSCDLIEGQKTGFFLDQTHNIELLCRLIKKSKFTESTIRILDLCCYVGHWSSQIARTLQTMGLKAEVTLVDVSEQALRFAKLNAEREGATAIVLKRDVLEELNSLPDRHYDIVIADPPAFIKAKKDVPTGRHAYLKLNASAFRLVKKGGLVVSCSCSGLFEEMEMMETLRKAIQRMNLEARCLARGGHAADHPNRMSFSEGFYLKAFIHQVKH